MDLELESCNPIFIKKTFQQQKNDFLRILDFENKLLASQVRDYFKDALELVMEPTGWVAFWKISRDYCSQHKLSYPAIVVVQVENVDFNSLVAAVKLITDEEDITLPEKIPDVPLIQLFPTMEQLFDSIDIHKTADILHDLRVFFNVLWYPWDDIVNRNEDWLSLHFENRLKLHYDIASGSIQRNVCITIENLISEGKQLYERINNIEEQLMHLDSNNCNSPKLSDIVASDRRFLELSQLQLKLNYIADQLTFYENSNIRKLLEKTSDTKEVATQNQGQCISLAWTCGTPEDLSIVMSKVNKLVVRDGNQENNMRFRCSESLEKLLIDSSETEKIFLSKGTYCLKSHILPNRKGGVIQGLNNRDEVIITDEEECCCLIDISSEEISLNNIEIRASKVSFILVVRLGKCNLNNVKISDNNSKKIGISVHSGAQLVADNCHFYGCLAAIHADKDSSVILRNCIFENNINGLEFEEGSIAIESCKFVSNQGNAIVMESSGDKIDNIKTGQDVLEDLDGVKMINTTFDGNKNDIAKHY